MTVTGTTVACVAAALLCAGYMHGLLLLGEWAVRKRLIAMRDWLVLPGLLVWLLALVGVLWAVNRFDEDLVGAVGSAALIGMTVGKVLPRVNSQGHIVSKSDDF